MRARPITNPAWAVLFLAATAVSAQEGDEPGGWREALEREAKAYPPERREEFRLFESRCAACHNLHRALSAEGVSDWAPVTRKMARKQGSGLTPEEARRIADFLNFRARRGEKPEAAAPPPAEKFPQWRVAGSFFVDANALLADRHSRDTSPEEGLAGEFTVHGDVALSSRLSATVGLCYGCHGIHVDRAYGEYAPSDFFRVRAGRFPVPLGAASQRYLPSNRESPSKPLPFIMGFMPRAAEFNLGVLPAPLVDTGAAVSGEFWPAPGLQVGAEVYAVRGLKGTAVDPDYIVTRDLPDNNGEPAGGARLTAAAGAVSLGASFYAGAYDTEGDLDTWVAGGDLRVSLGDFTLRAEVLYRDTDYFTAGLGSKVDRYVREGYTAQLDGPLPLLEGLRFFLLQDGLSVRDIFLGPSGPTPVASAFTTDDRNRISRSAAGLEYAPVRGFAVKGSAEWWGFSDFDGTWVFHLAAVFTF